MHILVRFLNECNTDEKNVKNNGECKISQANKVHFDSKCKFCYFWLLSWWCMSLLFLEIDLLCIKLF